MSGTSKNGVQAAADKGRAACVLLHGPGSAVPTDLLASLGKKIPAISTYSDSYLAFAEVCAAGKHSGAALVLVEPARIADAAELIDAMRIHAPTVPIWWYSQRDPKRLRKLAAGETTPWTVTVTAAEASLAVEPAKGPRLAPTLGPDSPRLKPGGAPAFRPAGKGVKPTNDPPRVVVRPGAGIGARRLRLVGDEAETRPTKPIATTKPLVLPHSPAGNGPAAPLEPVEETAARIPLLTEEELRMLLADDEPGTTNGPGKERSGH